jgi:hypothetical protein
MMKNEVRDSLRHWSDGVEAGILIFAHQSQVVTKWISLTSCQEGLIPKLGFYPEGICRCYVARKRSLIRRKIHQYYSQSINLAFQSCCKWLLDDLQS